MKSYKDYFTDKGYRASFFGGLVLLCVSLVVQFLASGYATRSVSGSVTDIILSNTRVYDVDEIFIYGTIIFFLFVVFVCLTHPKSFPFILKSVAVFTLIRSVFISLTHINIYPLHVAISSVFFQGTIFRGIFTGDGLFFSGHTGLPILLALIFWNYKRLRVIFICCSVAFALIVLLGHLHYSIDVLSAFFISYTIFHISTFLFPEDWAFFTKVNNIL